MNTPAPATTPGPSRFAPLRRHPVRTALALLALALLVLWLLFDWNWLRGPIARVVHAQTGREFEIAGDLDVDLGRITTVRMDAVRFGNAAWSKRGDMATSRRVQFRFELLPAIFRRQVRLHEVRLQQPRLDLELGPDGTGNWVFGAPDDDGEPLRMNQLWVDDGRLRYLDAKGRTDVDIALQSRDARGDAPADIAVEGKGRWKGNPLTLRGTGQSPLALQDPDAPYRLDLHATAGPTRAHARGTILDPLRFRDFDLKLALSGQNMDDLYPLIGVALPPSPPYSLDGRLTRTLHGAASSTWKYDGFSGTVGDSDLAGFAHVTTGDRVFFKADFRSKRLDFDDLAGFVGAAPQAGGKESSNAELQAQAARQAASPKLLPDTPYALDRLRAMDADVRLRAARLDAPSLPLDDMDAHLLLEDGVLRLDPLDFGVAGGEVRSTIRMDASGAPIRTRADIALRNLDLQGLLPDNEMARQAVGRVGGDIDLSTSGNSVATMLGNADGRVSVHMGEGRISKLMMEYAGVDIAGILRIKLTGDRQIPVRCVYGDFKATDGVLDVQRFAFDTSETVLRADGRVDLGEETLDLTIKPRPRNFSPLSLRTPIYVRGTFKAPSVKPDYGRMGLRGAAAVALGTVAAPAALLATAQLGRDRHTRCGEDAEDR